MPDFRVTVAEALRCPEGTTLACDGRRLLLADGRRLTPWITYEVDEDHDLDADPMLALGIEPALDVDRTVDPLDDH